MWFFETFLFVALLIFGYYFVGAPNCLSIKYSIRIPHLLLQNQFHFITHAQSLQFPFLFAFSSPPLTPPHLCFSSFSPSSLFIPLLTLLLWYHCLPLSAHLPESSSDEPSPLLHSSTSLPPSRSFSLSNHLTKTISCLQLKI